jgi:hypothetical protein
VDTKGSPIGLASLLKYKVRAFVGFVGVLDYLALQEWLY